MRFMSGLDTLEICMPERQSSLCFKQRLPQGATQIQSVSDPNHRQQRAGLTRSA